MVLYDLKTSLETIRKGTSFDVADAQREALLLVSSDAFDITALHEKLTYEFISGMLLHAVYSSKDRDRTMDGLEVLAGPDPKGIYWMTFIYHDPNGKLGWVDAKGLPTKSHPYVVNVMDKTMALPIEDRLALMTATRIAIAAARGRAPKIEIPAPKIGKMKERKTPAKGATIYCSSG